MTTAKAKGRRSSTFGSVDKLPSGNYRAMYYGPDGRRYKAPTTFQTKVDARAWLSLQQSEIVRKQWAPPDTAPVATTTFGIYAELWLSERTLKPRTRDHYRRLLDVHLLPTFAPMVLTSITPTDVRTWHAKQGTGTPTLRAHAYGLLRTIMATAVVDGLLSANPCHIVGAGSSTRVHKIKPASLAELEALVIEMPERYRVLTLLAAWCALRFGELTELRRKDIDLDAGMIHVRRGVTRVDGEFIVGTPKSDAGTRNVAIPPHLIPILREHMGKSIAGGREGLLFPAAVDPSRHLAPATLYRVFYRARDAAGRPDLRWHDLRHTGAVLAASTGATLAELMGRLGHSTPQAALRYQHAAEGRDAQIAAALSVLAEGTVQ
jgi:integrase